MAFMLFMGFQMLMQFKLQEILWTKALVELGRIRFSVTSGNMAQLLIKLEQRVAYIERRSSDLMGRAGDFWRHLDEEILKTDWNSHAAARAQLGSFVADFLCCKIARGAPAGDPEIRTSFLRDLREAFQRQSTLWAARGNDDHAEFWQTQHDEIEQLAETHGWFSPRLSWNN